MNLEILLTTDLKRGDQHGSSSVNSASERAVRERATKLLTVHRVDSNYRRRQSGISEEHNEKEKLIQDAYKLYSSRVEKADSGKQAEKKEKEEQAKASAATDKAAETLAGKRKGNGSDGPEDGEPDKKKRTPVTPKTTSTDRLIASMEVKDKSDAEARQKVDDESKRIREEGRSTGRKMTVRS